MYITTTYIGTLDGQSGVWCGFKPEGAIITEERLVLNPSPGYSLRNLTTLEVFSAVWLKDGDSQENYEEIREAEPTDTTELRLTRGDVFRGVLLAKDITRSQIRALIEKMPETSAEERLAKELAFIDFDEALYFYRALPIIDELGKQLDISSEQMTRFFITNDYRELT